MPSCLIADVVKDMIFDYLLPMLEERFPNQGNLVASAEEPTIVFEPQFHDFGDVEIVDDGDEITLFAGRFAHDHFSVNDSLPLKDDEIRVSREVVDFLFKLFNDRVVLWGSHRGIGGWRILEDDQPKKKRRFWKTYTWSGPVKS